MAHATRTRLSAFVLAAATGTAGTVARAAPPVMGFECDLPNGLYAGSGCTGYIPPPGQEQKCDASGTFDGSGAAYEVRCDAAAIDTLTWRGHDFTPRGPYAFVGTSVGANGSGTLTNSTVKVYFTVTSTTLPSNAQIPILVTAIGDASANAGGGELDGYGTVSWTGDVHAYASLEVHAISVADPPVPSDSATMNQPLRFSVPLAVQNELDLNAMVSTTGGADGWVFVDPLPVLDVDADAASLGLPADWMDHVVLELSPGADAYADAPSDTDAGATDSDAATTDTDSLAGGADTDADTDGGATTSGCSACSSASGARASGAPLLLVGALVVASARRRRRSA